MTTSRHGDRRHEKRFRIECPVTVETLAKNKGGEAAIGRLYDIGAHGARLYLSQPLEVGTAVVLRAHFTNPSKGVTRIRFEGIVVRSHRQAQYEIAVRFRFAGKFLREGLTELLSTGSTRH